MLSKFKEITPKIEFPKVNKLVALTKLNIFESFFPINKNGNFFIDLWTGYLKDSALFEKGEFDLDVLQVLKNTDFEDTVLICLNQIILFNRMYNCSSPKDDLNYVLSAFNLIINDVPDNWFNYFFSGLDLTTEIFSEIIEVMKNIYVKENQKAFSSEEVLRKIRVFEGTITKHLKGVDFSKSCDDLYKEDLQKDYDELKNLGKVGHPQKVEEGRVYNYIEEFSLSLKNVKLIDGEYEYHEYNKIIESYMALIKRLQYDVKENIKKEKNSENLYDLFTVVRIQDIIAEFE